MGPGYSRVFGTLVGRKGSRLLCGVWCLVFGDLGSEEKDA